MTTPSAPGARNMGDGRTRFTVWAPAAKRVEVRIVSPEPRVVALRPVERDYHEAVLEEVRPGARYLYVLDGRLERPDPASRLQPEGVHGPSEVVESGFPWTDGKWKGLALEEYLTYELHVGLFTPEGTFEAIISRLDALRDLGVSAVELMPVAQFPGERNWGYDGVYLFGAQNSYGGPDGLRRLVDACHARDLAVVLDVVYNHLGPEGNYLADFGPYFTERYATPWGRALNFDGPRSDEVRRFFIENALYWVGECHVDALRLDAVHGICDFSAMPFLEELGEAVHGYARDHGRRIHLIAESDLNDSRVIRPREAGGLGLDAQWNDDFHHALHALLTGEQGGYYRDFGKVGQLARALNEGFVYAGDYSEYRQRRHGNRSADLSPRRFVVCAQNHDQIGNRALGERLSDLVPFEALKLAASAVLLSPYLPLLFMGEEYGEPAPFFYFVSHSDPALVEAVRRGRRAEFSAFAWKTEPPDPPDPATFLRSRPDWALREKEPHRTLLAFYRELIRLRRTIPALAALSREDTEATAGETEKIICLRRGRGERAALALFNFSSEQAPVRLPLPAGAWRKRLDSAETRWRGGGSRVPAVLAGSSDAALFLPPHACALFQKEGAPES